MALLKRVSPSVRWGVVLAGALALLCAADSTMRITVTQLKGMIASSIKQKIPDKEIAQYLRAVKLTERLDDQTIDELEELHIGPKTLDGLKQLQVASASLREAPPPPPPKQELPPRPPPDSLTQHKIIDAARDYALNYDKQLPNFICVQVTRRFWDRTGTESWAQLDTITQKLSYYDHQEKYETVSVSNHPDDTPLDRLGGTISRGEFGSQLREIFSPEEQGDFEWDHWGRLRGKIQYVFAYRIEQRNSHYRMVYGVHSAEEQSVVPGYHGKVYIDQDTGLISRLTLVPDIPPTFPVRSAETTLDYDYATIGDNVYLLPLAARLISKDDRNLMTRNDIEFHMYRRFGTETKITFAPDAIPDDKLKEESPGAPKPPDQPK